MLYVDDEVSLLEIGKWYLEKTGSFTVDTAGSAGTALLKLGERAYDAVVSDYQMPEMNGIELLKRVRKEYPALPFIIFTGRGGDDVAREAIENGANSYIQKSDAPDSQFAELIEKFRSIIAARQRETGRDVPGTRYRRLFETAQDGILILDEKTGDIIDANPFILALLGYSRGEIIGKKPWDENGCIQDKVRAKDAFIALKKNGNIRYEVLTLQTKSGKILDVGFTGTVYPVDGTTVIQCIIRDITDRIRAEDALRESEEKYRDFFRTSRDGVFITTMDGSLDDMNDGLVELFGYADAEELRRVNVLDLYADPEERKEHIRTVQERGSARDYPVTLRKKDGDVIHSLITTVVRKDGDGNAIGFQGTIRDVTERLRTENALRESEEKFRNIFDQINDAIHIIEIQENGHPGRFVEVNDVACRMLGYGREELLSQGPLDSVTEYHSHLMEGIVHDLATKGYTIFETEHRRKDGSVVPVEINARRVSLLGQDLILAIVRDITERRQAEEALQESEKRYRNVVEGQTEFICRFTPDGTHIFVNEAYCRYFGKGREELIGYRFTPGILPEDRQPLRDHFVSLTIENPVATVEHRIGMPDGTIRWQNWSDRAIFDPQGKLVEYQSVGRDVTDRKEAELALKTAHEKLNMLNSITRHDIQNKLMVVRGYISIIGDAVRDPDILPYLEKMKNAAGAIGEQLEFARDYQDLGMKFPVWLTLGNVLKQVGFQMPPGPPDMETDFGEDLQVYADPLFFKVWYNLWENTLRHAGQATTITVTAKETPEGLVIIYADDGQGIPLSEKENIFERGHGKNTGLGLFFVREILAITGMTIRETGEPGKGARFEITVPKGAYRFAGSEDP